MPNLYAITGSFKKQALDFIADPQWIIPSLVAPFTFTLVTLMIYPERDASIVLYAVLGGGILGMWSNSLRASGFSINYDRMVGTLESLMVTPTPLMEVIAGRAIWNALIGLLNSLLVFILAEVVFQTSIRLADPLMFFIALAIILLSLSTIGLFLAAFFVFTRASSVLTQILELPIFIISGAMIPINLMPSWSWPLSFTFGPFWGVDALQIAAGVSSTSPIPVGYAGDLLILFAITAVYLTLTWMLFKKMDGKARESGSLGRY
jgi:ABC-2 type transport system permease protein